MSDALAAFARAVGWGTLAGAAPYLVLFMIPLAFTYWGDGSIADIAILFAYPLAVSGAMVLGSAVLFGLPLTAILSRDPKEDASIYGLAGFGLGAAVPAAVILILGGEWGGEIVFFAIPGAFAGLVTGLGWGRWREALNR